MKTNQKNTPGMPVLLAALAGAGAGVVAGMLLAPIAGAGLRQNLHGMVHKYVRLASEQQQQLNHHLAQRARTLGLAYKDLSRNCQGYLMQWDLLPKNRRLPY